MAMYKMIGVAVGPPLFVREQVVTGAPSASRIAAWARHWNLGYVARYFPSKKGWVLFDMRSALAHTRQSGAGRHFVEWVGIKRDKRIYPSEDAVVMKMIFLCSMPVQEQLNL